jgi:hypothetical protein
LRKSLIELAHIAAGIEKFFVASDDEAALAGFGTLEAGKHVLNALEHRPVRLQPCIRGLNAVDFVRGDQDRCDCKQRQQNDGSGGEPQDATSTRTRNSALIDGGSIGVRCRHSS